MNIFDIGQEQLRFLSAYDIPPGQDITLTVRGIRSESVMLNGSQTDVTVCDFAETSRPMVLNITNKKTLAQLAGTADTDCMVGLRVLVGVDMVKVCKQIRPALRIRPVHPHERLHLCADCGQAVQGYGKMDAAQVAEYTGKKYGRCLCAVCAERVAKGGQRNGEQS